MTFSFSFPFYFPSLRLSPLNRLFKVQSEDARKVPGLLACGKEIAVLDSTHGENAVVLLVCYRAGVL
jgi:hypothetical protein